MQLWKILHPKLWLKII